MEEVNLKRLEILKMTMQPKSFLIKLIIRKITVQRMALNNTYKKCLSMMIGILKRNSKMLPAI